MTMATDTVESTAGTETEPIDVQIIMNALSPGRCACRPDAIYDDAELDPSEIYCVAHAYAVENEARIREVLEHGISAATPEEIRKADRARLSDLLKVKRANHQRVVDSGEDVEAITDIIDWLAVRGGTELLPVEGDIE